MMALCASTALTDLNAKGMIQMKLRIAAFILSGGALVALAFLPRADADADANSYLAYIENNHVNTGFVYSPTKALSQGNEVCTELREGVPPDKIGRGGLILVDLPGIIFAAQHELCPDTLR
jgi:uncharacterized protein DUF732